MSERASERPGTRALAAAETFAAARAIGSRGRRLLPPLPSRPAAAAAHAEAGAPARAGARAGAGARGRGAGRRLPPVGTRSCSAGRGRPRGAGLSASPRSVGRRTPRGVGRGVPAAATHAGAGSGGGADPSPPGPQPCRRPDRPPGAVASHSGVYEPGPPAQEPPPGRGGGDPDVKRPRRRGERPGRRCPLLPLPSPSPPLGGFSLGPPPHPGSSAGLQEFSAPPPRPSPPGLRGRGGLGGPAVASAQRKLYPNKIFELSDCDCPGTSGPGRAEATACRDPGREKAVSGAAAAAAAAASASIPAARKRPG